MTLPKDYEQWVEKESENHDFPSKPEWVEGKGNLNSYLSYEVGDIAEENFEKGARMMYEKLMTDLKPAIDALKFYGDRDQWQDPDIYVMYWTLWEDGDNIGFQKAEKELELLKEKGLIE